MAPDPFVALVENLRRKAELHKYRLSQSEALTRYALIDPVLNALGWDTANPNLVVPEYWPWIADYLLLASGKPIVLIETKPLGLPLEDVVAPAMEYCRLIEISGFAVTDGLRWQTYRPIVPGTSDDRMVDVFNLAEGDPKDAAHHLSALWRPDTAKPAPLLGNIAKKLGKTHSSSG